MTSDALHRPLRMSGTNVLGNNATFQETYDHFGNRNVEYFTYGNNPTTQPSPYFNFTAGNNRADNQNYYPDGNLKSDGTNNYLYDAEKRLCAVQQTSSGGLIGFFYAPDGPRLGKQVKLKSFSCDVTKNGMLTANGLMFRSLYTFGPQGEQLGEVDQNFVLNHFNVFWEGQVLGSYTGTSYDQSNWHFSLHDWLGTKRVTTKSDGTMWTSIFSGPFGDYPSPSGPGSDPSEHHFTGKERDTETNLDYFPARYYNSNWGRFLSPDPQTPTPLHLLNPQRWNMYGYGLNNLLSFTDSGGRDAAAVNFSHEIAIVGHEGIMSVHSDGTVEYARFGPLGGGRATGEGQVQSFTLNSKVQFDSSGQPTTDSLNAVKQELSTSNLSPEQGQDPSSIRLNYFKTTDAETANLDQWIKQQQDASNRGQSPRYNVLTNNCTMFCQRGLVAGSAMTQSQANKSSIVPNIFYFQLSQEPKATVTTSECDTVPDGSQRCQ